MSMIMLVVVIRYQGAKLIGTTNQPISDDMKRRIIIFYNPICMKYQIAIEHRSYSSEYLHWISESFTEYSICFNSRPPFPTVSNDTKNGGEDKKKNNIPTYYSFQTQMMVLLVSY